MDGGDNSRDNILDQYLPNIEIKMETSIKGRWPYFGSLDLGIKPTTKVLIWLFKWHHDLRLKIQIK